MTDFIEVGQPEPLCQMHDNCAPFQCEYTQRNKAAVTASYITNYIFKLSFEYFKDLNGVKSLTIIK